jgi:peptidyl-prolyl cis-trans isomerase A (cyclophilin A)
MSQMDADEKQFFIHLRASACICGYFLLCRFSLSAVYLLSIAMVSGAPSAHASTLLPVIGVPASPAARPQAGVSAPAALPPGLYAVLDTTMGQIVIRLFERQAPHTVANFVRLAKGERSWREPQTRRWVRRPFYNGLRFHQVIPGFMIETGDPRADGTGGPGYMLPDELDDALRHDRPGRVTMASDGPDRNGSRFMITVAPAPWMDRRHTIFGEVVEGMDVATRISNLPRDVLDRPRTRVTLRSVTFRRVVPPTLPSLPPVSPPALHPTPRVSPIPAERAHG